ncbi:ABC transporter permease [Paenibacillus glycinis]|uniref:ABC transporter permease subunit n=1 Tax=Paenibacillus glycinis TaxID=2697035 RepID=A0ABW9XXI8_9BACL|nr:ABC transporter permease subunit [Paenibacillus glycinis]NBD27427.1 ABC transporter permease subunit [Paenibacillus glycinis]
MEANHELSVRRPLARKAKLNDVSKRLKRNLGLYLIISPAFFYFVIWHYWPLYGIQIAFKDYMPALGIGGSPWVGLEHFNRFFNAYYFWTILKNTLGISLYGLLVGIPAPIVLALMFNEFRNKRFQTLVQTISYAPHFISVIVAVGILFFFISPTNGVINALLGSINGSKIDFLAEPGYFWPLFVWSGLWQGIGWSSLLYTAAMSGISPDQYEAAYIDGANKFRRIWHVTLPGILPTIVILSILSIGGIMNVGFEKVLLMQTDLNLSTSEVISTYMYKSGILDAQYSFSAAVGLFNNVINFILLLTFNAIAKRAGQTSLW